MSILPPEASLVFSYIAIIYNVSVSCKLIYNSFANPKYIRKAWNLTSGALMFIGTILMFMWYSLSLSVEFLWGGMVGCFLILVNNLIVTIFAFKNDIEASKWGKVVNVLFTMLALQSFMFMLNFLDAQTAFGLPSFLDWLMIVPTVGYAAFQAFLYGAVGYFYPALILIPLVVPLKFITEKELPAEEKNKKSNKEQSQSQERSEKTEKNKSSIFTEKPDIPERERRSLLSNIRYFLDNGAKGIYSMLIILLFVFSLLNIGTMSSYGAYRGSSYQPVYPSRSDFELGASLKTITYQQSLPDNYEDIFQKELEDLIELNATTVRIDVKAEIIDNYSTELQSVTSQLKANGFKIMLSTYGYGFPTWDFQEVNISTFQSVIQKQAEDLISLCNPEFLLIYPEPLGFSSAYLDDLLEPSEWLQPINDTYTYLRSLTNYTKIGINLSYNDFNRYSFDASVFEVLWANSSLDFMGLDYYIIHARELDLSPYLQYVTNSTKEFWILEFGLSAVMYGEKIQEAALARLLEICLNDDRINGFIYFSLTDDLSAGNSLGLVAETGHRRRSFFRYKDIISQVTS